MSRAALPADMEADWQAEAEVCGWGVTAEGGQSSDVLMSATVPIVTDAGAANPWYKNQEPTALEPPRRPSGRLKSKKPWSI